MIEFTIPGHPVGRQEPQKSGAGHWFTPKKTKDYYEWTRLAFIAQYPKGKIKCDSKHHWSIRVLIYVCGKKYADNSNVRKGVEDALQGFIWENDKQIIAGSDERIFVSDKNKERVVVYAQQLEEINHESH